jgi:septum formation protein
VKLYSDLNKLLKKQHLVLASGSPRRVRLLQEAGIKFRQIISEIDEPNHLHSDPYKTAMILAGMKIAEVKDKLKPREVGLGCDTIVVINDKILGKPTSPAHALEMLMELSGYRHTVCSAIALRSQDGPMVEGYETTEVYFNEIKRSRLEEYVRTEEPLDKAGAYGIQGLGGFLVDRIEGNLDNVIGLPLILLNDLAAQLNAKLGIT